MNAADEQHIRSFVATMQAIRKEKLEAVQPAILALNHLVRVCQHRTGQGYKIRALLYSLWNGKPAKMNEILALDWQLRKDLLAVMLAFGQDEFFYDQIKAEFIAAGLFDWFIDQAHVRREPPQT